MIFDRTASFRVARAFVPGVFLKHMVPPSSYQFQPFPVTSDSPRINGAARAVTAGVTAEIGKAVLIDYVLRTS